jgi:hypothetical protein
MNTTIPTTQAALSTQLMREPFHDPIIVLADPNCEAKR